LQLVREAHADQARALGLPDGMPLGHVESVRERRDDLGLTNLTRASLHELRAIFIGPRNSILKPRRARPGL
jgi:hypothetical protein